MQFTSIQLLALLLDNPNVHAVWNNHDMSDDHFMVATTEVTTWLELKLPPGTSRDLARRVQSDPFKTVNKISNIIDANNPHQGIQNRPLHLGCQIQAADLPWLATAGFHAQWTDPKGQPAHGFLTTWSSMCAELTQLGHAVRQPTTNDPFIGHLVAFTAVDPEQPNTTDAALIRTNPAQPPPEDPQIIGLGPQGQPAVNAFIGMHAIKSGPGTRVQRAHCVGVNVAARVHYGQGSAIFIGQDLYQDFKIPFATYGDAGSGIFETKTNKPASLLFARGGPLTLGNPIQELIDKFDLTLNH